MNRERGAQILPGQTIETHEVICRVYTDGTEQWSLWEYTMTIDADQSEAEGVTYFRDATPTHPQPAARHTDTPISQAGGAPTIHTNPATTAAVDDALAHHGHRAAHQNSDDPTDLVCTCGNPWTPDIGCLYVQGFKAALEALKTLSPPTNGSDIHEPTIEMTIAWHLPDDYDTTKDWRDDPAFDRVVDAAHTIEGYGDVHVVAGLTTTPPTPTPADRARPHPDTWQEGDQVTRTYTRDTNGEWSTTAGNWGDDHDVDNGISVGALTISNLTPRTSPAADTKKCDQCGKDRPADTVHTEWVDPIDGFNGPVPVTVCTECSAPRKHNQADHGLGGYLAATMATQQPQDQ